MKGRSLDWLRRVRRSALLASAERRARAADALRSAEEHAERLESVRAAATEVAEAASVAERQRLESGKARAIDLAWAEGHQREAARRLREHEAAAQQATRAISLAVHVEQAARRGLVLAHEADRAADESAEQWRAVRRREAELREEETQEELHRALVGRKSR